MSLQMVTDRTAADVSALAAIKTKINKTGFETLTAAEQARWAAFKGAYTATDINRVEAAVASLQTWMLEVGYGDSSLTTKTWTKTELPPAAEMDRILANVKALTEIFTTPPSAAGLPSDITLLGWAEANAIEQVLADLEVYIDNLKHTVDLGWALGLAHIGVYGGIA